ncbi:MAG: hypothetical protein P9L92_11570 [Candidatus Electryonea clarkiae]|nr:hypothetical protein [Candidatus Electryonea clarkiae]MDP8285624.1 hypothetical protein [Candidatus Electryonea clarkiae]
MRYKNRNEAWDNLGGNRDSGKTNTAEFVNGLWGTFSGLKNIRNLEGLDLPNWVMEDTQKHPETPGNMQSVDTVDKVERKDIGPPD